MNKYKQVLPLREKLSLIPYKQSLTSYKVVFIDWNGTISGSKFWWHLEDKTHPKNYLFEKIESALFGSLKHLIKPWMRGEIKSEEVLKRVAGDANLNFQEVMDEFVHSCQTMQLYSGDLFDHIQRLREKGIKVIIATDNMDSFSRWTTPALELSDKFDEIINSADIKALKGDFDENGSSLFFKKYIEKYQLNPGEAVLIDDSEDKEDRIGKTGITYLRIEPVVGLIPALKSLLN